MEGEPAPALVQYVVLLPLTFNDGSAVPDELHQVTYEQFLQHFTGATIDEVSGMWSEGGQLYEDRHRRVTLVGRMIRKRMFSYAG